MIRWPILEELMPESRLPEGCRRCLSLHRRAAFGVSRTAVILRPVPEVPVFPLTLLTE